MGNKNGQLPTNGERGRGEAEKQIATQNSLGEPEKLVTQNSPPAQGTGGEGGGQRSDVFLGCLRGMGHYQDFSMADILERVEFKRVGGGEKAPSAPREIPVSLLRPRASSST